MKKKKSGPGAPVACEVIGAGPDVAPLEGIFQFLRLLYGEVHTKSGRDAVLASNGLPTGWKRFPLAYYAISAVTEYEPDGACFRQPGTALVLLDNPKKKRRAILRFSDFGVNLYDPKSIARLVKEIKKGKKTDAGRLLASPRTEPPSDAPRPA